MLTDTYTQSHVRRILRELGISISGETYNDFLCLCPFHGNRNTPSFSVSFSKGLYLCFNPSCDASGTILELVKEVSHRNDFEALRFIQSMKSEAEMSFEDELAELLQDKPEFAPFDQAKLDDMYLNLLAYTTGTDAQLYLSKRFIGSDLIDEFRIGYSINQKMIIVPVHSPDGIPVGLVGRGVHEKTFKNSRNLPRSKTMFNLHRAKKCGGTVIVCESSFDAIRIHGAGFPNVVATLGGYISKDNLANLNRYFNRIIIMTDFDNRENHIAQNCRKCYPESCKGHNPGRDLGMSIANALKNKDVQWAMFDHNTVYPHGAKDAGDLTDEEIRQCIKNSMSHIEYSSQNIY
ncbi:MAG: toprim domain-containing protein [Micrococcales bacterium]|nr:toprim domain-containing protein [Micrococcales bacterium]